MRFITCKQGTPEWLQARAGVITASLFGVAIAQVNGLSEQQQKYVDAIRSGATEDVAVVAGGYKGKVKRTETVERAILGLPVGEPSEGSNKYAGDVAIEQISGKPYGEPPRAWVLNRGHELEADARRAYETRGGLIAEESGIVLTDDGAFGYSTDGLVNPVTNGEHTLSCEGLIEIKCPVDSVKIREMLETGDLSEYMHQMQGGMWITGAKWCDFIQYVPDLESVGNDLYVKRVMRDDAFIDDMVSKLMAFKGQVAVAKTLYSKKASADVAAAVAAVWPFPTASTKTLEPA